jgi:hypothetical protein
MTSRFASLILLGLSALAPLSAYALGGAGCVSCGGGDLASLVNQTIDQMIFDLAGQSPQGKNAGYPVTLQPDPLQPPITIHVQGFDEAFRGAMIESGNAIHIDNPALQTPELADCEGNPATGLIGCVRSALHGHPASEICRMLTHEAARTFPQEIPPRPLPKSFERSPARVGPRKVHSGRASGVALRISR